MLAKHGLSLLNYADSEREVSLSERVTVDWYAFMRNSTWENKTDTNPGIQIAAKRMLYVATENFLVGYG